MPTEAKKAAVAELTEALSASNATIVADYRGLTVSDIQAVRRTLRSEGITYRVVKNRLAKIAAKDAGREELNDLLDGPTGLAMGAADEVTLARVFLDAIKPYKTVVVRGGVVGAARIDAGSITRLAQLPSRDVLLAQLAGGMASPLATMAGLLAAPLRNLGYALSQLADKKGQEAGVSQATATAEAPEAAAPEAAPEPKRPPRPRRQPKPKRPPRPRRQPKPKRPPRPRRQPKPKRPPRPRRQPKPKRPPRPRRQPKPPPRRPPAKTRPPNPTRLKPKPLNTDYDRRPEKEYPQMATKVTQDDLLEAIDGMTVLELSEFIKKFEERYGVTAAAPAAAARRRRRWRRWCCPCGRCRGAERVQRRPDRGRPEQDPRDQGRTRVDRLGPQGGQGPCRCSAQAHQGRRCEGRGREGQGRSRGAGRKGRDQVDLDYPKAQRPAGNGGPFVITLTRRSVALSPTR